MSEPKIRGAKNSPATLETMIENDCIRYAGHTFYVKPVKFREWKEYVTDKIPVPNMEIKNKETEELTPITDEELLRFMFIEVVGDESNDNYVADIYDKWLERKVTYNGEPVNIELLENLGLNISIACRLINKVHSLSNFPKL